MIRNIRIAAGICVHNEEDFIEYALRGIYDLADVIAVCVNVGVPWGGAAEEIDSTLDIVNAFPDPQGKLRILPGEWANEIDQRNANLDLVRGDADYFMILDADEFYTARDFERIKRYVAWRPWIGQFRIRVNTYWKTNPVCRIDPPEPLKQYIISRIRPTTRFVGLRMTNERWRCVIPTSTAILHHFSYSRPPKRSCRRFGTSAIATRSYRAGSTGCGTVGTPTRGWKNLHPTNPPEYKCAVPVDPTELPEAMRRIPTPCGGNVPFRALETLTSGSGGPIIINANWECAARRSLMRILNSTA